MSRLIDADTAQQGRNAGNEMERYTRKDSSGEWVISNNKFLNCCDCGQKLDWSKAHEAAANALREVER